MGEKKSRGRPSKLDASTSARLAASLVAGNTLTAAAHEIGVSRRTAGGAPRLVLAGQPATEARVTIRFDSTMVKLNDKQIALLLGKNFGSLAVLDDDGSPEITPVWVDWDGEYVLVNTLQSRMKPRRVEGDARVAIAVVSSENPYQHVRIKGRAELSEEGAEEHIDKLAQKYLGQESYPRGPGDRRVIVRIRPEQVADYNL